MTARRRKVFKAADRRAPQALDRPQRRRAGAPAELHVDTAKEADSPMQHIRRRLSPSLIVASLALFVALAGTAAAAVIIDSPDQIKDGVVTGPKLATDSVSTTKILTGTVRQQDQANPTLRYSVASNGKLITGDMGGDPQHVPGSNRYDLSFSSSDVGPLGLRTCAFAVSPRFDFTQSPGKNGHLNKRAYVNYASGSNTFQVFTFEQLADGSEIPSEAAFDVVVGC
jgi:hypothetical protein